MSHDEGSAGPVVVRFEMAITPAEFQRLVPHLPGADKVRVAALSATMEDSPDRHWRIALSNTRSRKLGLVKLPVADVEIALKGYSRNEAERFIERFHLIFRKGGG